MASYKSALLNIRQPGWTGVGTCGIPSDAELEPPGSKLRSSKKGGQLGEAEPEPETHLGHGLHHLWRSHFGADEHPFAAYFDVHQGYRVLAHRHFAFGS